MSLNITLSRLTLNFLPSNSLFKLWPQSSSL